VVATQITERMTGSALMRGFFLGQQQPASLELDAGGSPDQLALLACYREACNALNPMVRALWFARIIEGIRNRRQARSERAIARGESPVGPSERFPDDVTTIRAQPAEREELRPYAGRKFNAVADHFKTVIRNSIAHLDPTRHALIGDRYEDVEAALKAIPALKYMSREMMATELTISDEGT